MKRTLLGLAVASAIASHLPSRQFSPKGRNATSDPFKPNTRARRRQQSPAERLMAAAQKQRREAGG